MPRTRRPLPLLIALLAAAGPAAATAVAADTVADRVFGANLLNGVARPGSLEYRYELRGEAGTEPVTSRVAMEVREVEPSGDKRVWFDMFEGPNRRQFGPMEAREQNPLVIVFLQRDVAGMGNLSGGQAGYFQQQIRRAFAQPAEVAPIEVQVGGRAIRATRVVMRPFRDDPAIARFPKFKDKAYEFVVAPEVPGGLYRIASSTPGADGRVVLEESMTFERATP